MADTVTVGGKKFPKWQVWAVGVGGVVAVYFVMKARSNASNSSTATAASGTGTDPVTGLPYSEDNTVDPLTGQTYLAEAQQYGSVSAAEAAIQSGSYGAYTGGYGGYGSSYVPYSYTSGTQTGTNYTSNAQWAQAVEAGLTDIGYAPTDISGALGRYLAGLSLTSTQASIVQAGLAEYGNPPVGSFQVILAPSTTPTPSGSGSNEPVTEAPTGLHTTYVNPTSLQVQWQPVPNAKSYWVRATQNANRVNSFTTSNTIANIGGLKSGETYQVLVSGIDASGNHSSQYDAVTVTLPK